MNTPLSGCAASPLSRIAARFGKEDTASARKRSAAYAAWRPLRGGHWQGLRQWLAQQPRRSAAGG